MNLLAAIFAAALSRQNPSPSYVTLPPGWSVDYNHSDFGSVAEIDAPDGLKIFFPFWDQTGNVAAVSQERDSRSEFASCVIGGRKVQTCLSEAGELAVSFQEVETKGHSLIGQFDYWATVTSPQQAAEALAVTLSNADHPTMPFIPVEPSLNDLSLTIMGTFQIPRGYVRKGPPSNREEVYGTQYTYLKTPDILVESQPLVTPSQAVKWSGRWDLLKKNLVVTSYENGILDAHMESSDKPYRVIGPYFECRESTSKAALLLILSAATYVASTSR